MSNNNDFDFDFNLGDYTNELKRAYEEFQPLKESQLEFETGLQTDAQEQLAQIQKDIDLALNQQNQGFTLEQLNAQYDNEKQLGALQQQYGLETLKRQTEAEKQLARQSNQFAIEQARLNNQLRLQELAKQNRYSLINNVAGGLTGYLFS